ncbi:hypothetical protein MKW98_007388 [Papaver atlanticum]|uniref:Alcohol dehydrogenase-like C-terminal domain-containing protein n=1 Tax=Papaver atlanticum TaxID=357466 RepID=A0AAD4XBJ3_9MAGN|nr:hypothetical protein MKW98_007388 [Papaver atlanticum]
MLEAAIVNMNPFGRVVVCGAMSEYTDETKRAVPNMMDLIFKRISIQGFITPDYMKNYAEFASITSDYIRNAKLHVVEDISIGLESIPSAFVGMFRGDNIGKKMVELLNGQNETRKCIDWLIV